MARIKAVIYVVAVVVAALLGSTSMASAASFDVDRQKMQSIPYGATASWHFFGIYSNAATCINTGSEGISQRRWINYRCTDGVLFWRLDVYY
ncbi:hypothetical protein [Amycolatopsis lexingtonensis]|uniref:hypothetical protein n=1 Tax=Amycolatopsis lexingtonensis TaxID=218822 RepID=UPI003F7160DB